MMKQHYNTFVCLNDISVDMDSLDYVIYNPNKWSTEFGKKILHDRVKERFEVDLTDKQIKKLFKYDVNHLSEFVHELSKMVKNK